jgi:transcriptional regulator with XRE-family HTH domain
MTFAEKIVLARDGTDWSQEQLGERIGVSRRSVNAYENEGIIPRDKVMRALAQVLDVSLEYLRNDEIDDPDHGKAREAQIDAVRNRFGAQSAKEAARLLEQNAAFFAGGGLPQEDKDAFFEAVMSAYLACKETARVKFGRNHENTAEG